MVILRDASVDFGQSRIFFMHNWRCGGTTLNSLFSSNFGNKYLKVGTQFSEFGWPLYQLPELLKLEDVRSKVQSGWLNSYRKLKTSSRPQVSSDPPWDGKRAGIAIAGGITCVG